MVENWFDLNQKDQLEVLEVASAKSGRPAHLLEKDIWVVWALSIIYSSPLGDTLTFKGGTSLSKVYQVIDRFSEDIDLTYDIRSLVQDLLRDGNPIPESKSHEKKITSAVRERLPVWIKNEVQPIFEAVVDQYELEVKLDITGIHQDKLILTYPALKKGTGYIVSAVQLEFGARATGEPHQAHNIASDAAPWIKDVVFPTAQPLVMAAERTFWEKATAAHVYCLQQKMRGERYSRHWFDLVALANSDYYKRAITDRELANQVAAHKAMFFSEKDMSGNKIDYHKAVNGTLQLVPEKEAYQALLQDYVAMREDGLLHLDALEFDALIEKCSKIEHEVNHQLK